MRPDEYLSSTNHRDYRLATQNYLQRLIYRLISRLVSALKLNFEWRPFQPAGLPVEDQALLFVQLNPDGGLLPSCPAYDVQHA